MSPVKNKSPSSRRGLAHCRDCLSAAIAVVIVVAGITTRKMADARLREWTEKQAVPVVAESRRPTPAASRPRSICAGGGWKPIRRRNFTRASSGYIKEWKVEIGTAGQDRTVAGRNRRCPILITRSCRLRPRSAARKPTPPYPRRRSSAVKL